jgi:hypothetical protein
MLVTCAVGAAGIATRLAPALLLDGLSVRARCDDVANHVGGRPVGTRELHTRDSSSASYF